ncbi:MAG TPA: S8 family serine peptidase [Chitinophaga sp.]|uniref:S8 family serine peptidase n=1 Tax=Chitinophaga sp. TaxID=1869181 RepID=UPI002BF159A9|nr:S8 family serine peptidase [Chitinophaga sp.]HVI47189.1 S8 family serine peptidase [Chitinophaga sp.]
MKRRNPILLIVIIIIIIILLLLRYCSSCSGHVKPQKDSLVQYKLPEYYPDQLVVLFNKKPSASLINKIKGDIKDSLGTEIDTAGITVATCSNCGTGFYMELWKAKNIHSYLHAEPVQGGTHTDNTKTVGDTIVTMFRNYKMKISPGNGKDPNQYTLVPSDRIQHTKDTVTVALLDSGLDTSINNIKTYLWRNVKESGNNRDDDSNCLTDDEYGWNFVDTTGNINDDAPDKHGTHVAMFIINEFQRERTNNLKLMVLKTHDRNSEGSLFNVICAMLYAADHHANVINASWGFYSNFPPLPDGGKTGYEPLDSIITQVMASKGILFVTAAGNRMASEDEKAEKAGIAVADLRNLKKRNFFPACFATNGNNVIAVTTVTDTAVSPTQNYSSEYVDLGVLGDRFTDGFLMFKVPLMPGEAYVSGSSYATGIVTGRIAAGSPTYMYNPRRGGNAYNKTPFFQALGGGLQRSAALRDKAEVKDGNYIKHR